MTLSGRAVVVTRCECASGPLGTKLAQRGAIVIRWPTTESGPPPDQPAFERALTEIATYDWIVFSSARSVKAVTSQVSTPPGGVKVAVVGPATAAAVESAGWQVDLMPEQFDAESLVAEFRLRKLGDTDRVLFPCSSKALDTIPGGLIEQGARVDRVVAYETSYATLDGKSCLQQIESGAVDAITFTSPSAIGGLVSSLGDDGFRSAMRQVPAVVIGPSTERALKQAGSVPAAVASPSTFDGLVNSLATYFDQEHS